MKNVFSAFLLILICVSCKRKEIKNRDFEIIGKIKNLDNGSLVVLKSNSEKYDSVYSKNGEFSFKLNRKNYLEGLYDLNFLNSKDSSSLILNFWNEGKNIEITGNYRDSGSVKVINSHVNNICREYFDIIKQYDKKVAKVLPRVKDPSNISNILQKYLDSINKDQVDLLFKYPNNYFSLDRVILQKEKIPLSDLVLYYNKLSPSFKQSKNGRLINDYLDSKQVAIGKEIVDFKAKTIDGKSIKLSDFKGKIILLDFWANWCTWCHVQNKEEFTPLNKKYTKDLVIISYSLDEKMEEWKEAVMRDSYKWINLSNLKGMNDPITYSYKIDILPHSFLINKEGVVVKEFIGYEGKNLIDKEIEKILKKE